MASRRRKVTRPCLFVGSLLACTTGCSKQIGVPSDSDGAGGTVVVEGTGGDSFGGETSDTNSPDGVGGTTDPGTDSSPAGGGDSSPTVSCAVLSRGDVQTSTPSGTFQGTLTLELSTTIADAEIRYTTNGQSPTASSTLYSAPLSLTATTRLRAQAFVQGSAAGVASAAIYVARAIEATHDLPVIILDSYGSGKLPTDEKQRQYVDVAYLAFEKTDGDVSIASTPSAVSFGAFRVRGNSSAMFDKVPYRLELRNEAGGDRDCPVLGMPAEADWALVGPYADKTLIHNAFVYELGRAMGMKAPRLKMAEVYINVDNQPLTADDYQGVYNVVETIKNSKDRLDLKQLHENETDPTLISGGYIFNNEWKVDETDPLPCPSTTSNCWQYMFLIDPVPYAQAQKDYLIQYMAALNTVLHSSSIGDSFTGYSAYIEPQSWVDNVIINELTRNLDAFCRSQYYYKDRDANLNAGPLWDYDLIAGSGIQASTGGTGGPSFGGGSYANTSTEGWQYESNKSRLAGASADWFPILIVEPTFKARIAARWQDLRQGLLADSAIDSRIDTLSTGLSNAADRNFKKWNILTTGRIGSMFDTPTESTWSGQLAYMKTWLKQRAAWLDTQWR